jgi:hypothetical protein
MGGDHIYDLDPLLEAVHLPVMLNRECRSLLNYAAKDCHLAERRNQSGEWMNFSVNTPELLSLKITDLVRFICHLDSSCSLSPFEPVLKIYRETEVDIYTIMINYSPD